MSSFVLQLVPSRARALREAHRVIRPGGWMTWVTWLASDRLFAGDRIVDEVLGEAGFDPREPDRRPGDLASVGAAVAGMRRAGFRNVRAEAGSHDHPWDPEGFLGFLEHFDEETTFEELGDDRERVRGRLLERLATLSQAELTLRLSVVYVVGRVPG
jgi:SAM-dependent methyltransferase